MAGQHIDPDKYGQISAAVVPRNLNEEAFTAFGNHIKGATKIVPYLKAAASDPTKWDDENYEPILVGGEPVDPDYLPPYRTAPGLVDLHPNVLLKNNQAIVQEGFDIVVYSLRADPRFFAYGDITVDNYRTYWSETSRVSPQGETQYQFAEEYDGSIDGWPDPGMPPYDWTLMEYPSEAEGLWEDIEDTKRHRWYRYRVTYYDIDGDPVTSDYYPPVPIGKQPKIGVKVKNMFKRNGLKSGGLGPEDMPATPPPILPDGSPNNSPTGWSDNFVPTPTTEFLWVIRALVTMEGSINTEVGWSQPALVPDDENLTRFSATGEPHPKNIEPFKSNQNADASDPGAGHDALIAAGWVKPEDYDPDVHFFIATRNDLGGSTYDVWYKERLTEEEQEIKLVRYKLLPLYADWDDSSWASANRPVGYDPTDQGWVPDLQDETNFLVNYRSEAIAYSNKTIKKDWSDPRPFTPRDTYNDYISIHPDDGGDAIDATKEINNTPNSKIALINSSFFFIQIPLL